MKFTMNPNVEEEIAAMAARAVHLQFQPILDGLLADFGGQPVGAIKPHVAERWAEGNDGARITDPELTNIAKAISDGRRVVLTRDGLTIN